jgi:carboxyl-terminal processing protease
MLGHLDKVSTYLDAYLTKIYELYRSGTTYNLGIHGAKFSNYFYISDIAKDSPAEKAELNPGDIIKSIQGKSIYGLPYYRMYLSLLSDKPGNIELTVYKKTTKKTEKITLHTMLAASKIRIQKIKNNISLIKIPKIDKPGVKYLSENLKGKKDLRLIIDLRNYSGGNFKSFLEITKLFFQESPGFSISLKKKEKEEAFPLGSGNALDYRAVVIVNKSTIMYGELLTSLFEKAGQNKDRNITIIGSKTPGFLSELKQVKFADGSSILLSEGFFLLNDKKAAKSGIKPHIELKEKEFESILDRSAAILDEV